MTCQPTGNLHRDGRTSRPRRSWRETLWPWPDLTPHQRMYRLGLYGLVLALVLVPGRLWIGLAFWAGCFGAACYLRYAEYERHGIDLRKLDRIERRTRSKLDADALQRGEIG